MKRFAIVASVLLALVVIAVVASGRAGDFASADQLEKMFERAGPLAPVLFIALIIALFPVFLIGPPVWASLALWPAPLAILYSFVGCFTASVIFYRLARSLGREQARSRIPDRIRRYEDRLVAHPFWTIVIMRVLIWANPAVDLLIGVSRIRRRDYLLGTAAGLLPTTAFHVMVVGTGLGMAVELPAEIWIAVGLALGAFLLVRVVRKRRSAVGATAELPRDAG